MANEFGAEIPVTNTFIELGCDGFGKSVNGSKGWSGWVGLSCWGWRWLHFGEFC